MIPPPFEYEAPKTIAEAVGLLAQNADAKVLAGGQSLIPMMRFRLASPALLVDINRIDGLEYIREEDGWLKIGALTREAMLDRSATVRTQLPAAVGHLPHDRRSDRCATWRRWAATCRTPTRPTITRRRCWLTARNW